MTHVLVARMDSEGDVLLAGPAVRAAAHHADRVTLLCGPRGRAAAELLPGVDEVLVHHAPWIDAEPEPVDPEATGALVAGLSARSVDRAAILTSFHQSPLPLALLLRLAGVAEIAAISVDYPGSLLDHRLPDPGDVHEVRRGLGVVAALGLTLAPGDDGRLAVRREARWVEPAPYVVVHPGCQRPRPRVGAGAQRGARRGARGDRAPGPRHRRPLRDGAHAARSPATAASTWAA